MSTLESTTHRTQGWTITVSADRVAIDRPGDPLTAILPSGGFRGILRWFTNGQAIGPVDWQA